MPRGGCTPAFPPLRHVDRGVLFLLGRLPSSTSVCAAVFAPPHHVAHCHPPPPTTSPHSSPELEQGRGLLTCHFTYFKGRVEEVVLCDTDFELYWGFRLMTPNSDMVCRCAVRDRTHG